MQLFVGAAQASMMGILPPAPDDAKAEKDAGDIPQMPSSTSLCGIVDCPHHQLPSYDDRRGMPAPLPLPTTCKMTTASTMTSPVMTSGTTIANHYDLHHSTALLPPHHPRYPQHRTFVQHHTGKLNNANIFLSS